MWSAQITDTECRYLHQLNSSDVCSFVEHTESCHFSGGLADLMPLLYCQIPKTLFVPFICALILYLLILFVFIATTSDEFFCPILAFIAKMLRMNDNLTGITLVALGNGAADVFSATTAVMHMKSNDAGLAFGALLGGTMFISTLVVGTVALTSPFKSIERPLIRDLIVLLATAYWISCIIHNEQIRLVESIGFIVLYVVYIIVVVGSQIIKHFINKFYRQRSLDSNYSDVIFIDDIIDDTEDDIYPKFHRRIFSDSNSDFDVDVDSEALILPDEDRHPESLTSSFRRIFVVYSWRQFRSFGLIRKFYVIVNYPISLILRLSCPQLYYSMPNHNWNRLLNTFHCISSPLTIQLITATFQYKVSTYGIPLCYITVPISIVIAIIVWFSSMYNEPPIYFKLYAFIAFFVSIIWVYFIAGEIVNVLTALGIVMNLSNTLMGLSFLAFGNSIADLTADVILAKRGMQNAAVSACFAGPIFNLLIGVGCPFTIYTALNGTLILQTSLLQKVIPYCLIISIAYSLVILTCSRFQFSRVYGTSLCIGFIVYISICAFIETR